MRRVAVTGLGVISSIGLNTLEFWPALREGRSGIAPIESLDVSSLRFQNGAEVRGYDPCIHFDNGQTRFLDRFAQFALIAAREALHDADISFSPDLLVKTCL
jgi:nodulation protein E